MTQETDIKPGPYKHYKGGEYMVTNLSVFEETGEWMVHYYGTDGRSWCRRLSNFRSTVMVEGVEVKRFAPITGVGAISLLAKFMPAIVKMGVES